MHNKKENSIIEDNQIIFSQVKNYKELINHHLFKDFAQKKLYYSYNSKVGIQTRKTQNTIDINIKSTIFHVIKQLLGSISIKPIFGNALTLEHPNIQFPGNINIQKVLTLKGRRSLFPNVTIKEVANASTLTNENKIDIYKCIAKYGPILDDANIEVRTTSGWKILKKNENTMRTVSLPTNNIHFGSGYTTIQSLIEIYKSYKPVCITWINGNTNSKKATLNNLNTMECSISGIFGHEVAHIRQEYSRSKSELLKYYINYLFNKQWRTELEKINDAESVMMGRGLELYKFKMIVNANSNKTFITKKFEEYLSPEQILRLILYFESECKNYFEPKLLEKVYSLLISKDFDNYNKYTIK